MASQLLMLKESKAINYWSNRHNLNGIAYGYAIGSKLLAKQQVRGSDR